MNMTSTLNGKRMGLLLRNELLAGYKNGIIAVGAIIGVLLIINIASVSTWNSWNFNEVFFPITLFIGGIVATSLTFGELHNKQKGYSYLMIPASMFEKFLAKLLFTTLGYGILTIFGFFVFSLIAAGLNQLFFGISHPLFNPFKAEVWYYLAVYISLQSVIFYGSVYFKKFTLVKTVLVITGMALAYAMVTALLFRIFFGQYFRGISMLDNSMFINNIQLDLSETAGIEEFFIRIGRLVKILFWFVMPPFFWILSFLRLRETEVK